MRKVLVAWVGNTDLLAPDGGDNGVGPIAQAIADRRFDEAFLLSDYPPARYQPYIDWLRARTSTRVEVVPENLTGPTEYGEIHEASVRGAQRALGERPSEVALTFHLSPGTPAMTAVWIILGKTRFAAELIESSKHRGVRTVSVPFNITAEFIPDLLKEQDERLRLGSTADPPEAPEFAHIIHQSAEMARLIRRARKVAARNVPVVIEGESGTGKELFARAIHRASPRRDKPFIALNCGAIPAELLESELFGHEKGAFTNAARARAGHFESAHGGTLFLDEIGELPSIAQVKLLRVLQEGEIVRLGSSEARKIDVRILAATHKTLIDEVAAGRFREDLFYRLAVAVLRVPPLRARGGDIGLLVQRGLETVNQEAASELGFQEKKLSVAARSLLVAHSWPGNVRELLNTLRRASLWSDGSTISVEDVREALLPSGERERPPDAMPLGDGFSLQGLLDEIATKYLQRAMKECAGNKAKAAKMLGFASYQTLSNWLKKHNVAV